MAGCELTHPTEREKVGAEDSSVPVAHCAVRFRQSGIGRARAHWAMPQQR